MTMCFALMAAGLVLAPNTTDLSGPGWICDGEAVSVPHTWNATDAADGPGGERAAFKTRRTSLELRTGYCRKSAVYTRTLPDPTPGKRQFLAFDGVSRDAFVKVNGMLAGSHKGAFTRFILELTDWMQPTNNVLEVNVSNLYDADVAPISGDYSLQGGIYRGVRFFETPRACIERVRNGTPAVDLDIRMDGRVTARVTVDGGTNETHVLVVPDPVRWSPENPKLYPMRIVIASGDEVSVPVAFRTAEMRADGFYLNGRKRFLKGVNRHQDLEGKGWAMSADDERRDVALMRDMGVDTVRTAHYPQSENLYALLDEAGMMAWCEVPCLNGVSFSEEFEANLRKQAREMIAQLKHHPSIVMWSVFNELYENFPMPKESMEPLVERYAAYVKGLDATRPQVAASDQVDRTRLNRIPADGIAFNRYPGWYNGPYARTAEMMDEIFRLNPTRRSCCISEFGGGGSILQHGDPLAQCAEGTIHTEEYQAFLHAYMYDVMSRDPRIWGVFMWVMFDFASDYRTEGDRPGINDKGMMTRDRGTKKDVFHFYRANWTQEPVLHLVGKRMRSTDRATLNFVVFSNVGDVTLRVNGRTVATQSPNASRTAVFRDVPLAAGVNAIEATAGTLREAFSLERK